MTAQEILHCLVLDSVANDYESLETIIEEVAVWATEERLQVTAKEITAALGQLIQAGQVAAYRVTATSKPEVLSSVNLDAPQADTYFYITPDGLKTNGRLADLWPRRHEGDRM